MSIQSAARVPPTGLIRGPVERFTPPDRYPDVAFPQEASSNRRAPKR